jgi:hypothetical protein
VHRTAAGCNYRWDIAGAIFNMDKMIGGTFESGLAELKKISEQ